MIDMKSWLYGFCLGICGKPLPLVQKTPIGYSYNGVILPKLPEWDREAYPYAVICQLNNGGFALLVGSGKWKAAADSDGSYIALRGLDYQQYSYDHESNGWAYVRDGLAYTDAFGIDGMFWGNLDIYDVHDANTIVIPASDPIPVYE
jgi:hypothetical protein